MSKKALEITPGIEPLYGTRDENLRLLEDGLHVTIDLRSDAIHITGSDDAVDRVAGIFADFDALRKCGVNLHNGELNGMLKLVIADPAVTLKSLVDSGKQRSAGVKRMVQPRSPNQRKYVEAIETSDMTFGVGPAGTGKTYLAVAMAVSALSPKKSAASSSSAPRSRPANASASSPGPYRKRWTPTSARSTTPSTTSSIPRRSISSLNPTSSRSPRSPSCAAAPSTTPSSSWTRPRTPPTSR